MNSKYYSTWEEYKQDHPEIDAAAEKVMAPKIQKYEEMFFMFVTGLFI